MTRNPTHAPRPAAPRPSDPPDVPFAALPLLGRLRDELRATAAQVRRAKKANWGVPRLFFFDDAAQSEWEQARPRPSPAGPPSLGDRIDDVLTVLASGAEVRHAARAVPGLVEAATVLAADDDKARTLAELLAVPDDEVVRVVHPGAWAGFRVHVRGVADVGQFHTLLADAVTGDPGRGLIPGARPSPPTVAAARDGQAPPDAVATARFQFFTAAALRPDGTVPSGFAGAEHWLWPAQPLAAVPQLDGERVVVLGEPAFAATWDAARRWHWLPGELDVIEVMTAADVAAWVAARTGRATTAEPVRRAA